MSYYQQLYLRYKEAKEGMFNARDMFERAAWIATYRWSCNEIERHTAGTVSAQKRTPA